MSRRRSKGRKKNRPLGQPFSGRVVRRGGEPDGPTSRIVDGVQIIENAAAERASLVLGSRIYTVRGKGYREWVADGRPLPRRYPSEPPPSGPPPEPPGAKPLTALE